MTVDQERLMREANSLVNKMIPFCGYVQVVDTGSSHIHYSTVTLRGIS